MCNGQPLGFARRRYAPLSEAGGLAERPDPPPPFTDLPPQRVSQATPCYQVSRDVLRQLSPSTARRVRAST